MAARTLRASLTWGFALGAAVLSVLFAGVTYFGVRHVLVVSRQSSALQQAYVNAALVRATIEHDGDVVALLHSLDVGTTSDSYVSLRGRAFVSGSGNSVATVPTSLSRAGRNDVVRQVVLRHGTPMLYIAIPLPSVHAVYVQHRSLSDLNATLVRLLLILGGGAIFVTAVGAVAGRRGLRRALDPLETTAAAAREVADGDLTTRLPNTAPYLEVATVTNAFNAMVQELAERIDRDARFASDVSHELRSPLTTLAMTADVLRRHRDEIPPDAAEALDLLIADVGTFQTLVEDLLAIAKADAGHDDALVEELHVAELVRQCVNLAKRRHHLPDTPVAVAASAERAAVRVDRRRFERVMTNLIDNAYRYGDGTVAVAIEVSGPQVHIVVDDDGRGIAGDERARVFERFYRGAAAGNRRDARGSGLGLALVREHVTRVGGNVVIEDSPLGGARFRVVLQAVEVAP